MRCHDCPDLANGTRKRARCCIGDGGVLCDGPERPDLGGLKIGDRVPMPARKLKIRPAFTGPGKPSFTPARKDKR